MINLSQDKIENIRKVEKRYRQILENDEMKDLDNPEKSLRSLHSPHDLDSLTTQPRPLGQILKEDGEPVSAKDKLDLIFRLEILAGALNAPHVINRINSAQSLIKIRDKFYNDLTTPNQASTIFRPQSFVSKTKEEQKETPGLGTPIHIMKKESDPDYSVEDKIKDLKSFFLPWVSSTSARIQDDVLKFLKAELKRDEINYIDPSDFSEVIQGFLYQAGIKFMNEINSKSFSENITEIKKYIAHLCKLRMVTAIKMNKKEVLPDDKYDDEGGTKTTVLDVNQNLRSSTPRIRKVIYNLFNTPQGKELVDKIMEKARLSENGKIFIEYFKLVTGAEGIGRGQYSQIKKDNITNANAGDTVQLDEFILKKIWDPTRGGIPLFKDGLYILRPPSEDKTLGPKSSPNIDPQDYPIWEAFFPNGTKAKIDLNSIGYEIDVYQIIGGKVNKSSDAVKASINRFIATLSYIIRPVPKNVLESRVLDIDRLRKETEARKQNLIFRRSQYPRRLSDLLIASKNVILSYQKWIESNPLIQMRIPRRYGEEELALINTKLNQGAQKDILSKLAEFNSESEKSKEIIRDLEKRLAELQQNLDRVSNEEEKENIKREIDDISLQINKIISKTTRYIRYETPDPEIFGNIDSRGLHADRHALTVEVQRLNEIARTLNEEKAQLKDQLELINFGGEIETEIKLTDKGPYVQKEFIPVDQMLKQYNGLAALAMKILEEHPEIENRSSRSVPKYAMADELIKLAYLKPEHRKSIITTIFK
jgi:hypothetical protein